MDIPRTHTPIVLSFSFAETVRLPKHVVKPKSKMLVHVNIHYHAVGKRGSTVGPPPHLSMAVFSEV